MANMAVKIVANYSDSIGFKYSIVGENQDAMRIGFTMDNVSNMEIIAIFRDDDSVKFINFEAAKFPPSKLNDMYKVCNDMNAQYRWAKFYVDSEAAKVVAEDEAVVQLDSIGEEVLRCVRNLANICDDAFPTFMKAIYA